MALVLEVIATLWAFYQALQAGALDGDVQCDAGGLLETFHTSSVVQGICEEIGSDAALGAPEDGSEFTVGCDTLTAGTDDFDTLCGCDFNDYRNIVRCYWTGVSYNSSEELLGKCFAHGFAASNFPASYSSVYVYDYYFDFHDFEQSGCWPTNPAGTATLTVTATSVALVSQAVEAVVAHMYFKDPDCGPHLMVAASIFEAAGVVTVSIILVTLPSFGSSGDLHIDQQVCLGLR